MTVDGKRKRKPVALEASERQKADESCIDPTSDDIDKIVSIIHSQYKRKAEHQRQKAEKEMKTTINEAMKSVQKDIDKYEGQLSEKMNSLKTELQVISDERQEQVDLFKSKYKDLKSILGDTLKSLKEYDQKYNKIMNTFFESTQVQLKHRLDLIKKQNKKQKD